MVQSPVNIALQPHQLQAIGHVAAEWSYLESVIEITIWGLASLPRDIGRAITADMRTMRAKLKIIGVLAHQQLASDDLNSMDSIISRVGELEEKRNTVIHAQWAYTWDDHAISVQHKYSAAGPGKKKRIQAKITVLKDPGLEDIATDIFSVTCDLQDFLVAHGLFRLP